MSKGVREYRRYRFKTYAVNDNRPLIFNPQYPWWCSGYSANGDKDCSVIIAFLPSDEDLKDYWDDAFDVEYTEHKSINFSSRFPKPEYYIEQL